MQFIKKIIEPLASLKLTVFLLAISMIVVFTGTTAQKEFGILTVQDRYFHTFFAQVPLKNFFPLWEGAWNNLPGRIYLPGGYALIALLLVNLLAAHLLRFKLSWKRAGILLIHGGLILLLVGEIVTSVFQVESQMQIEEGQTISYSFDVRKPELAILEPIEKDTDRVTVVGSGLLRPGATLADPQLPFEIRIDDFYRNSALVGPFQLQQLNLKPDLRPTAGVAVQQKMTAVPQAPVTGTEAQNVDHPSAIVSLYRGSEKLGTYMLSVLLDQTQGVIVDGKPYELALRFKRYYKPYSITLLDFRFDRYTGTEMARNFSSDVRLVDPTRNEDREVKIWMNNPLRYAGETFFQASFDSRTEKTTVLQIVRNPGWLIPYISCAMVSLGLCAHFLIYLTAFLSRVAQGRLTLDRGARQPRGPVLVPALAVLACVVMLLRISLPPKQETAFDLNRFAAVPISFEGRVMPLDSVAQNSLRILSGKSTLEIDDQTQPAIRWLLDLLANKEKAREYPVFRIDHPDLLALLKLDAGQRRYSFSQIMREQEKLAEQIHRADQVPAAKRDLFQRKVMDLYNQVRLFALFTEQSQDLYLAMPQKPGEDWYPLHAAFAELEKGTLNPGLAAIGTMIEAYRANSPQRFNEAAAEYQQTVRNTLPATAQKMRLETLFNRISPFYYSMYLYLAVFLLICGSWMGFTAVFNRAAFWVLLLTLAFHTFGLLARMCLSGRPPVTNLYSSAIFIAWGAAIFCVVIERIYRNGIGSLAAAAIAGPSLIIAHYLAGDGDTMKMLQAVLDTNFWLATHVVIVTLGYAATFLAGVLGCIYIIGGLLTAALSPDRRAALSRMIYGTICFALLFSFVGTVLGGIWADQSWGRFWGWDPKENGAVLIVMWNAILLHARWGAMIRERGMATLAVFGNIVTSWSWFGTNMMGVGLHSYGFMNSAVFWLTIFVLSQLVVMGLGMIPPRFWRSLGEDLRSTTRAARASSGVVPPHAVSHLPQTSRSGLSAEP